MKKFIKTKDGSIYKKVFDWLEVEDIEKVKPLLDEALALFKEEGQILSIYTKVVKERISKESDQDVKYKYKFWLREYTYFHQFSEKDIKKATREYEAIRNEVVQDKIRDIHKLKDRLKNLKFQLNELINPHIKKTIKNIKEDIKAIKQNK